MTSPYRNSAKQVAKQSSGQLSARLSSSMGIVRYILLASIAGFSGVAHAQDTSNFSQNFFSGSINSLQSQISSCNTALNEGHTNGRDCIKQGIEQELGNKAIGLAFNTTEQVGKHVFGEYFQVKNRLNYSAVEGVGVQGNLDTVIPLTHTQTLLGVKRTRKDRKNRSKALKNAVAASAPTQSNLFLQQGVTRWQDDEGVQRNDMRWGLVYRFNLTPVAGENILGFATFVQQNAERGHSRLITRYDYSGKWGKSWVNYYRPTTGWVDGREGYQERAVGGSEVGHKINLTDTVNVDVSASQWESTNSKAAVPFEKSESIGVEWKPHKWVTFTHRYSNKNTSLEPVRDYNFSLNVPLGRDKSKAAPRWTGLGVAGQNEGANPDVIWDPVDNLREIKYVERVKPVEKVENAKIEFLAPSVESGDSIPVKITLPSPASEETKIIVRLEPGETGEPAVAGEDYIDEPVTLIVAQGQQVAEAEVQILHNNNMTAPRSIKVIIEQEI